MTEKNKKLIMPALVLTVICLVVAALLAGINMITKDIIAKNLLAKENEALTKVYPNSVDFEELTEYPPLPEKVVGVYDCGDGGYIFKTSVKGYASGLVILVGVDPEGKITGAQHIESNETYGYEEQLNSAYNGKSREDLEVVIATGATSKSNTSFAYYDAMDAALLAFGAMGGKGDFRTPDQVINELLGTEGLTVTKWLATEDIGGSKLYLAESGEGLVIALDAEGNKLYAAFNAQGTLVNESELDAAFAQSAKDVISAYVLTQQPGYLTELGADDIAAAGITSKNVLGVKKTSTGNYIITVKEKGYAAFEYSTVTEPITVQVVIGTDGVIISTYTVEQHESENIGDVCATPEFYERYDGTDKDTYKDVENTAGATYTSTGYKNAVKRAFSTYEKLVAAENAATGGENNTGGTENE